HRGGRQCRQRPPNSTERWPPRRTGNPISASRKASVRSSSTPTSGRRRRAASNSICPPPRRGGRSDEGDCRGRAARAGHPGARRRGQAAGDAAGRARQGQGSAGHGGGGAEPAAIPRSGGHPAALSVMPEWTPRMQEVCEVICRYALETGEMPTLAEVARRMGLSRTRIWGLWCAIERYERRKHLDPAVHLRRRDMGYLLAVLKDIARAARIAGRVY